METADQSSEVPNLGYYVPRLFLGCNGLPKNPNGKLVIWRDCGGLVRKTKRKLGVPACYHSSVAGVGLDSCKAA